MEDGACVEAGFEEPLVTDPISKRMTSIPPKFVHAVWIIDKQPQASISEGSVIFPENRFVSRFRGRSAFLQVKLLVCNAIKF
ncbi:hypothetical protein VTN96DRAFT_5726 [Rasamsonia emersonii]